MKIYYAIILSCLLCLWQLSVSAEPFTAAMSPDRVFMLPGLGAVKNLQLAGYLPVVNQACVSEYCHSEPANLFFWFVASNKDMNHDPIILWLNGGPGSSSFYGFFTENGPYTVNKNGTLHTNPFAWNAQANYLMFDQPAGVGFSYREKNSYINNEAQAINQLYNALQVFYQRYPAFIARPLYLAGESYAGKYLPELAVRILAGNTQLKNSFSINLQGVLIGDGWVNPLVQQEVLAEYAYTHGLIDQNTRKQVQYLYQQCAEAIKQHAPSTRHANQVCKKMADKVRQASGDMNLMNISTNKEPDYNPMIHYLNDVNVRHVLHADPRLGDFKLASQKISDDLEMGEQDSAANLYPILLAAGVRVLIYNGLEDDTDSNFIGTDKWLAGLDWYGKNAFSKAPTCVWRINGNIAGYVRTAAGLTQVKIRGAGHMAPADKPLETLDMVNRFIKHQPFCITP